MVSIIFLRRLETLNGIRGAKVNFPVCVQSTTFAPLCLILHDGGHEVPVHAQGDYEHEHFLWMYVYAGDLLSVCARVNAHADVDGNG